MNFADVMLAMRAQERINLHDLGPEMPELARDALLAAAQRFRVGLIGIIEFLPEPAPRAGEDARRVWPQLLSREPIAGTLAVLHHADGNIDPGTVEPTGKRGGNIAMEGDRLLITVQDDGNPAARKSVEADRPQPRFSSLKKSLPLSSMMMKAGKSTTSMRQIASMPSSGYSTTSTFLMQCSARFAAAPPIEPR